MMRHLLWIVLAIQLVPEASAQDIHEEMRILQYVVTVRVTVRGKALKHLKSDDFMVENHGKAVPISSVQWIDQVSAQPEVAPSEPNQAKTSAAKMPERTKIGGDFIDTSIEPMGESKQTPPREARPHPEKSRFKGRFIAIFIQNDLGSNRNQGLVRMIHHGKKMIQQLHPDDWVAVFSFDSHLKMHLDFTQDHQAAIKAVNRCLRKVPGKVLFGGDPPSVADAFNIDDAQAAADPETGLTVIAKALEHLPGEKLLAYIGWGFGSLDQSGVKLDNRYDKLKIALYRSNITVFSLDLTVADYHSLERAMKQVARDTGGFYERTANHPAASITRFLGSIEGYYLISFGITDTSRAPEFKIRVKDEPVAHVTYSRDYDIGH